MISLNVKGVKGTKMIKQAIIEKQVDGDPEGIRLNPEDWNRVDGDPEGCINISH